MLKWARPKSTLGFTIVELLIVVVVIAILAAITIVAYNGIQDRARSSAVQSGLSQGVKAIEVARVQDSASEYPSSLPSGLAGGNYYYNKISAQAYCLTQMTNSLSYFVTSSQASPVVGSCESLGAMWTLNNTTNDSSGNQQNGSATNVTAVTGQNGGANGAYSFNGTDSSIVMANNTTSNSLKPPLPLSVSMWFNLALNTSNVVLFQNDQSQCSGTSLYAGIKIYAGAGGGIVTRIGNGGACGSPSRYDKTTSTGLITTGRWYHLAVTFDASRAMTIYLDGTDIGGSYGGTATSLVYTTMPSRIGASSDGSERLNGSLDDVRVFGRLISQTEIQALIKAGAQ